MSAHRSFCFRGDRYLPHSVCSRVSVFVLDLLQSITQKAQYLITRDACLGQDPGFAGAASPAPGEGRKLLIMNDYKITCLQGNLLFTNPIN